MRRNIGSTEVSLKALIYGKEGTRKSNTAIQVAKLKKKDGKPMKVLLIDLEYKSIEGFNEKWLVENSINPLNILEDRTRDLNRISTLVNLFTNGMPIPKSDANDNFLKDEYELDEDGQPFIADAIILDSISVLQSLMVEGRSEVVDRRTKIKIKKDGLTGDEKEMAFENSGMQLLDWNKLQTKALKLVRDLQAVSGKHVFYISRAKDAIQSTIVNGKIEMNHLGYEEMDATSFRKFLPYEVSLVLHTKDEDDIVKIHVKKDSTGTLIKGSELTNFDISVYEDYINNVEKKDIIKTKSYDETLKKSFVYVEDSEEGDAKTKIYDFIVSNSKSNPNVGLAVKEYCNKNNIPFKTLNTISEEELRKIKVIVDELL